MTFGHEVTLTLVLLTSKLSLTAQFLNQSIYKSNIQVPLQKEGVNNTQTY
jgi:hypothetical protein